MIYGRSGNPVHIVRRAILGDVQKFDKRRADRTDKAALAQGSYWIVADNDTGKEHLYHLAYLRADGGSLEVYAACQAVSSVASS